MTNLLSKLKQAATGAAATSSGTSTAAATSYSASNPPRYVYKILPTGSNAVRYAFPIPLPASYVFPSTELDAQDGFMHLSTHEQVPLTLARFFAGPEDDKVTLVRCDYQRLSSWKFVKWEPAGSSGSLYPHLYAQLEGELVDDHREIQRDDTAGSSEKDGSAGLGIWDSAVKRLQQDGFLQ